MTETGQEMERLISLGQIVASLGPGERFALCLPTRASTARLLPAILQSLLSTQHVLCIAGTVSADAERARPGCEFLQVDRAGSKADARQAIAKRLKKSPKNTLIVVDATRVEGNASILPQLWKRLQRDRFTALWVMTRDSCTNSEIAGFRDSAEFFVDVTSMGSYIVAQVLSAEGLYNPELSYPRSISVNDHGIYFGPPVLPAGLIPADSDGPTLTTPTTNLLEQKYRTAFDLAGAGIFMIDFRTRQVEANPRACELLGVTQEELRLLNLRAVVPPERFRDLLRSLILVRKKGKGSVETRVLKKSGRWIDIRALVTRLREDSFLAVVQDLSESKNTETQLREREERYRTLAESVPLPLAVFVNRRLSFRNSAFDRAFHVTGSRKTGAVTIGQLLGKKNIGIARTIDALANGPEEDKSPIHVSVQIPQETGGGKAFEVTASPVTLQNRKGVECVFVDVSRLNEEMRKLTLSEERYRGVTEQSPEAISIEYQGRIAYANRRFLELFGFASMEEVEGKESAQLPVEAEEPTKQTKSEGGFIRGGKVLRENVKRADGRLVNVEVRTTSLELDGKRLVITYWRDVSETRDRERETGLRIQALEEVRKASAAVRQLLDVPQMVRVILEACMRIVNCELGVVLTLQSDGLTLSPAAHEGFSEKMLAALSGATIGEGLTGLAAKTQEPVLLTTKDYPAHLPFRSLFESEKVSTVACVNIPSGRGSVAVVVLASRRKEGWTPEQGYLLSSLTAELGPAMQNSQAYSGLAETEALRTSILETVSDVVYRTTAGGSFVYLSPAVQSLTGYSAEEFYRNPGLLRDIVHPDDRVTYSQRVTEQAHDVQEVVLEYRLLPRGKATYRWIRDAVRYLRTPDGQVVSATGVMSDISGYKIPAESSTKTEGLKTDILNSIREGVLVLDGELRYLEWNRAMEEITGVARDAVLGQKYDAGVPAIASEELRLVLARALAGEVVSSDETPFEVAAALRERVFWSQYAPLRDAAGVISGVVGIMTDVTHRRELEREVRESEETLRNVIDTMGDALVICDLEGRVWEVNREFTRLTGHTRREARGKEFPYPWVLEEDMAKFLEWIAALREKNYLRDFDMTWKAKTGQHVAISMNTTLLRNALGEPVAMLNIARDISERKHLMTELERRAEENARLYAEVQAQVRRVTSLYELGKSLTGTLDTRTVFDIAHTEVQKAIPAEEFVYYRFSPADHLLLPVYEAVGGAGRYEKQGITSKSLVLSPGMLLWDVVSSGRSYVGPAKAAPEEGGSMLAVPIKSKDTVVGLLVALHHEPDVLGESHLRLFESIANLTEIAAERALLYDDTVLKAREIESRNKDLDDFTYVVSHDLKEPLISIEGYSKILQKDYKNSVDQDGKDYLAMVVQSSAHMKRLIDDLLTLSRVGHVKESAVPVSASEVVEEVLRDIRFTLQGRNVTVDVAQDLPTVRYNRTQLGMVFRNLIANAVKFNDKPQPRIEIGARDEGQHYVFWVRDNGIGIDEQYFEKIFTIFQRLQRKEEYEGTGAGLTIVKKIVENHHGQVSVQSVVGEGTTMSFTVPK